MVFRDRNEYQAFSKSGEPDSPLVRALLYATEHRARNHSFGAEYLVGARTTRNAGKHPPNIQRQGDCQRYCQFSGWNAAIGLDSKSGRTQMRSTIDHVFEGASLGVRVDL